MKRNKARVLNKRFFIFSFVLFFLVTSLLPHSNLFKMLKFDLKKSELSPLKNKQFRLNIHSFSNTVTSGIIGSVVGSIGSTLGSAVSAAGKAINGAASLAGSAVSGVADALLPQAAAAATKAAVSVVTGSGSSEANQESESSGIYWISTGAGIFASALLILSIIIFV